jgi:uncharacterized OsmC-like protein
MVDEVVYTSRVKVERIKGPLRRTYVPAEEEPIYFSVHSEIAEHYGIDTEIHEPHKTTLDMLVASTATWLTGTLGGALVARGIPADEGRLHSKASGEIEKDGNILVVRRIHVTYYLKADAEKMDKIERAHQFHAKNCPVARTIWDCVDITTSLELV